MPEVLSEMPNLLEERLAHSGRHIVQGFLRTGEVIDLQRGRLAFLAGPLLRSRAFMSAIISSAVLNGPKPWPFLRSSSDSSSRASMMRRCSGVYSSSAFGNWERSMTNLGVITILPRWKAKFTRSPLDSPAWRRTLVGMVTWPLCWILAVVFIKIYSD